MPNKKEFGKSHGLSKIYGPTKYIEITKDDLLPALGFDQNNNHPQDSNMLGWKVELINPDQTLDKEFTFKFTEVYHGQSTGNSVELDATKMSHLAYSLNDHPTHAKLVNYKKAPFDFDVFVKERDGQAGYDGLDFFFLNYSGIKQTANQTASYYFSNAAINLNNSISKNNDQDVYDMLYIQMKSDDGTLLQYSPSSKSGNLMPQPLFLLAPPCPPDWTAAISGFVIAPSTNTLIVAQD